MKPFGSQFVLEEKRRIVVDPIRYLKGFVYTGPLLRRNSPEVFDELQSFLFEVIGPERAAEIQREQLKQFAVSFDAQEPGGNDPF